MSAGVPNLLQQDSLDRAFPRLPCFPSDQRGGIALSLNQKSSGTISRKMRHRAR